MKQKIVIRMRLDCEKCRSKAMQVASVADGVTSVAIEGKEKDQVVVIGDGVDATKLTSSLRKKLSYASLESVEEVKAKVDHAIEVKAKVDHGIEVKAYHPIIQYHHYPVYDPTPYYYQCTVIYEPNPPNCSIM